MDTIDRTALVHYTAQEMFALVSDITAYPQFLQWCSDAEILSQQDDGVTARIEFSVGKVKQSFTTRNRHQPGDEIGMQLVDGPFSQLEGCWQFESLGEAGCKISLQLNYDFSSKMLSLVVGPVFGKIANSLVDAFQKRAVEVYGER